MISKLIEKYNQPGPRYTSYPTVPHWKATPTQDQWLNSVQSTFNATNSGEGISLYIHLPYCESLCTYCACTTRITVNHAVERDYIQGILAEWEQYKSCFSEKPIIKSLHLGGGTPTFFSPQNLCSLICRILEGCGVPIGADFSFEGHPGNTSIEHLKALRNIGFKRVSFGVQDFDENVQDLINRHQSFEQVREVIAAARELGYKSVNLDLVYGLPGQMRFTLLETIQKVLLLKPDRIALYSYAHVPLLKPAQRAFEGQLPNTSEKLAMYKLSKNVLLTAGYAEIGMDHYSLKSDELYKAADKGELHRNFMGYTDQKTTLLIGLGASSISDNGQMMVQNTKVVEDYLAVVNNNRLAIAKGHILSQKEKVIRAHILDLMCRFKTTWKSVGEDMGIYNNVRFRLLELQKDKLVRVGKKKLQVTQEGKAFVRNIAMAFDPNTIAVADSNTFSKAI